MGAWMGSASLAADGVPARFLDPDAPGPPKKASSPENPSEGAPEPNKDASLPTPTPAVPGEQKEPAAPTDPPSSIVTPAVASPLNATLTGASAPVPPSAGALSTSSSVAPPTPSVAPPTTLPPAVPTPTVTPAVIPAITTGDDTNTGI